MNRIREFLQRLFASRYILMLEMENARLRSENRALVNSLLGTAGFPPVDFPAAAKPQSLPRVRKRSWHQIQNLREQTAARDAGEDFAEAGPARSKGAVPHS